MTEPTSKFVVADQEKLRAILSEKGLPLKLQARLNPTEQKVHTILCSAYSFKSALVEIEIPNEVLNKLRSEFKKIWSIHSVKATGQGKSKAFFMLTPTAIRTTLKTVILKDKGILHSKINSVVLHDTWTRFLKAKEEVKRDIDWSEAEAIARRRHEEEKEKILDGKTFNAHKDNPWARKNLKNRNQ